MVNSFSEGKGRLVEPSYGSYPNQWQLPVNSNFGLTDALISGTTTLNTSSLTPSTPFWTLVFQEFPVNPTPWKNPLAGQNLRVLVTGALTYNATIFIPQNFPGMWLVDNQTTGTFTVAVKTNNPSSTGITVPQGYMSYVFCDGTNVYWADKGGAIANSPQIPAGIISPFGGPVIPSGYLLCNGASHATSDFPALFAAIGYTWGGSGLAFNVPDLQGMFLRGVGGNAPPLGQYQADGVGPLTISDPGHVHLYGVNAGASAGSPVAGYQGTGSLTLNPQTTSSVTGIQITNTTTETRPKNMGVFYIIKT